MVKHDEHIEYDDKGTMAQLSRWLLPIVIFFGALGFYVKMMAPSIFWGDSAAFATTNYLLGVPPSPSYPLYTLLGRVFAAIPGLTAAFAANLMSAFFAALAVMVFYMLARQLMNVPALTAQDYQKIMDGKKLLFRRPDLKRAGKMLDLERATQPPAMVALVCFALTALFAVGLPVWLSAVRAEVYSLQLFMTLLAVYFCARALAENSNRPFLAGLWVYALSFANHPIAALVMAPPFIFMFIVHIYKAKSRTAFITAAGLLLIMSFSTYVYLPLRTALDPSVGWGRPDSLQSLGAAVSGMINMADITKLTAADYWLRFQSVGKFLGAQIGWLTLALLPLGLWGLFRAARRLNWFFILAILSYLAFVLWMTEFSVRNADTVSLLAPFMAVMLLVAVSGSLYQLRRYIVSRNAAVYFSVFLGIFVYFTGTRNMDRADLSEVNAPDIICEEILGNLPGNSLLVVADDDLILPLWYFAVADSSASDIKIVSSRALSLHDYRKRLVHIYPDLIYPEGFTGADFAVDELTPDRLCQLNLDRRDVFVQYGVTGITVDRLEPHGVVFRYLNQKYDGIPDHMVSGRFIAIAARMLEGNPKEISTIDFVSRWLFNTSAYFSRVNTPGPAWELMRMALDIDNDNIEMRLTLSRALARAGRYKEALKYIADVLDIDPYNVEALQLGQDIAKKIGAATAATTSE
jgi:tetratricopeptide (TPR) repeat protein